MHYLAYPFAEAFFKVADIINAVTWVVNLAHRIGIKTVGRGSDSIGYGNHIFFFNDSFRILNQLVYFVVFLFFLAEEDVDSRVAQHLATDSNALAHSALGCSVVTAKEGHQQ